MIYKDYNWEAKADYDNPKTISSNDFTELNRTEGNEVIYYIRSLAKSWNWKDDAIKSCQKIEKTIRTKVPEDIKTYGQIKHWIEVNFKSFWDSL